MHRVLFLLALLGLPSTALAQNLVVNGSTITLGGTVTYDSVQVINGGRINVAPYNGDISSTGVLHIIANSILVDATSQINGVGDGYRSTESNGEGPGGGVGGVFVIDGGGGGGH